MRTTQAENLNWFIVKNIKSLKLRRAFNGYLRFRAGGEAKKIWLPISHNFYGQWLARKMGKVGQGGRTTEREAEKFCRGHL